MRDFRLIITFFAAMGTILSSCGGRVIGDGTGGDEPSYIQILERAEGGWTVISVSPFDGSGDTLVVEAPMERLVVMSTSHIGFLDAIGRLDAVVGVSGLDYVYPVESGPGGETTATLGTLRGGTGAERSEASGGAERSEAVEPPEPDSMGPVFPNGVVDVGYDAAPDYEKIVSVRPDLVLTYSVSAAKSPFVSKLEQLGIKTLTVNEHLEGHPLARASYVRLFGALTGEMAAADSVLEAVKCSYRAIAGSVAGSYSQPRKVLLNIPYNDQWFIPSKESYLTSMIKDAGGEVLGAMEGRATSSVISVEKAYTLSKDADCWLNVGWCSTMSQLTGINPIFEEMLRNIRSNAAARGYGEDGLVWNDNKRLNPKGGNDIWQSGVARPDLALKDLASILHPGGDSGSTIYYQSLD
ncbi:MAG: ABC transporter substrate-binding protein [Bacteroidales bacterium]|nr:ABC transporter substrate-binding protein [Bacteroidales bacterium]